MTASFKDAKYLITFFVGFIWVVRKLTLDGHRLQDFNCEMHSNRWIFIRGLGRHSAHWGKFLEVFKHSFPDAEIECIDIAGNGNQDYLPSLLSIPANVDDLRRRAKLLSEGPVNLMTISLGSMIGVDWATRFPQEICGLVLTNTSDGGTARFFERMRPLNYKYFLPTVVGLKNGAEIRRLERERAILEMTSSGQKHAEEIAREWSKYSPTSIVNLARQLIAASRFRFPLLAPPVPTLILASQRDTLVNPICSAKIAKMWGAEVAKHPTAGHDIPLDDASWVCAQIRNWLNQSTQNKPGSNAHP